MSKEAWKSVREVATLTAVGATEGALIGTALGVGFMSAPGYVAGGIVGGVTALTAELVGRIKKKDVIVVQKVSLSFKDTERDQSYLITSKVKKVERKVPLLQVPDTILRLNRESFTKATGRIKEWQLDAQVADHIPAKSTRTLIHKVNLSAMRTA